LAGAFRRLAPDRCHRGAAQRDHVPDLRFVGFIDDEEVRMRMLEDVREPRALQCRIDRHQHRAQPHQREERDDVIQVMRQHDGHVHAGTHAVRVQDR
jgi:hypothetical protein